MNDSFDPSRISAQLEEAATLRSAGQSADADRVLSTLRDELVQLSELSFRTAVDKIAAGDTRPGEEALLSGIVLQRQFATLAPAWRVSEAEHLSQLASIYLHRGQTEAARAAIAMAELGYTSFYNPPATCQIAVLDALYGRVFGLKRDGVFVEVGAFDGESYGNTSGLADLGWRGLYIEPIPENAARCRARHAANPAVTVEVAAIGAEERVIDLAVSGPLTRATDGSEAAGAQIVQARQRRLDDVLAERGIAPSFDLLVVDVEGYEPDVFAGFALSRWRPRMMIVELTDEPEQQALAARIAAAGYVELYRDFVNTVFVAIEP